MKKKIIYAVVFAIVVIVLATALIHNSVCRIRVRRDNENFILRELSELHGIEFELKLTSKEPLVYHRKMGADIKIKGARRYVFDAIDSNGVSFFVAYTDPHFREFNFRAEQIETDFEERKNMYLLENEMLTVLEEQNFILERDVTNERGFCVFILLNTLGEVERTTNAFNDLILECRPRVYVSYSLYVINDEKLFNSIDYSVLSPNQFNFRGQSNGMEILPVLTPYAVTRIATSQEVDTNVFDNSDFEHIVLEYRSEPNALQNRGATLWVLGLN
ncbi:MAG: hypothetical protein FWD19_03455 [Defluviitaleaceae bacterium]|nr:hypothetical protein [Defluviitaleaceae bacterium]